MIYVAAFTVAFLIAMFAVPPLKKLAKKYDFADKPTARKKHKKATPLIGGVAMFASFTIVYLVFIGITSFKDVAVLFGGFLVLAVGVVDDYFKTKGREFAVFPRALVQFMAAALVFAAGIRFTGFSNPFADGYILLPVWLQFLLTVVWIFGCITVINFTDGLDGLAGSLSIIPAVTLFITAAFKNQTDSALMCVILIGSVAGFLKYNFYPAKIFMGDSGAYFLGYLLAVISLHGVFKQATMVSMFIPVLALGVPIFDNVLVIIRRFIERKPIYKADSSQIHYRLLAAGLNTTQTVAVLMLVSVCLNLTSIIILLLQV